MPKYVVRCSVPVHLLIEVEADSPEAALDAAMEHTHLSGYCGNGGADKLVGTAEPNVSLEAGDGPLEGNGWEITVEEA